MTDKKPVFLIAGRNTDAIDSMVTLLEHFGLKTLGWDEARSRAPKGADTAAVVKAGVDACSATVVLLTGDDEVRLRKELRGTAASTVESVFRVQARPNVLFEAGMAYMKSPATTIFVVCGLQKVHHEVKGVNRIDVHEDPNWRSTLKDRLESTGTQLSLADGWAKAGDFSRAIPAYAGTPAQDILIITQELPIPKEQLLLLRSALTHDGFFQVRDVVHWLACSPAKARFHSDELAIAGYLDRDENNPVTIVYRVTHNALKLLNELEMLS